MIYNVGGGGATSADRISYDNTESQLEATNVQDGIDEINQSLGDLSNIETSTYNSVAKLLQFWIDNGELTNPNIYALIPKMTSNTTPYGIASTSKAITEGQAWNAFDQNNSTGLYNRDSGGGDVKYKFVNSVNIKSFKMTVWVPDATPSRTSTFNVYTSTDDTTFELVNTFVVSAGEGKKELEIILPSVKENVISIKVTSTVFYNNYSGEFVEIQAYGQIAN